ncbi:hypothetical protein Q7C_1079 [Methylophaga frappieri]|uniref:Uncharacterized protein n=1 Tax=Methylophaga frappieri (strain ATCC BAA-2434 / DSM 25690 / JAM7) TaxID=754477 RepID=I1YH43_METFJ|nr:hypothetical protein Q7C_1079 [Methylophaga frappieri]
MKHCQQRCPEVNFIDLPAAAPWQVINSTLLALAAQVSFNCAFTLLFNLSKL